MKRRFDMENIFYGLITALITPFKKNAIDYESLEKLIKYQIDNNVASIVICGSTGEGTSLTIEESQELIFKSKEIAQNKIKIIVGNSSGDLNRTLEMTKFAINAKANGFMCSIPPYVKPTQEGIYQYFETIHNNSDIPIMLYSVPSRTGSDFKDETIINLSKLPRIMALKDAGNDLQRPIRLKLAINNPFNLLSGDDMSSLAYNANGGIGCVSVGSNFAPALFVQVQNLTINNDFKKALEIHKKLYPFYHWLSLETNPVTIKYSMYKIGMCENEVRAPLTTLSQKFIEDFNLLLQNNEFCNI
jgi:4-hydroxy-tetrahydrodipicolinate synthase